MFKVRVFFSLVLIVLGANELRAENKINWDSGYPKVTTSGCMQLLEVSGTLSLDCGWGAETEVLVRIWEDGLLVAETNASVSGNAWSTSIPGLAAATYNVIVEAVVVNGCNSETIITAPATATIE